MRRVLVLLSWLLFLCDGAAAEHAYLVQFDQTHESVEQFCQRLGFELVDAVGSSESDSFVLAAPASLPADVVIDLLDGEEGVRSVEAVTSLALAEAIEGRAQDDSFALLQRAAVYADLVGVESIDYYGSDALPDYVEQPSSEQLRLGSSHRKYGIGRGIVAIIDTGVDPHHPLIRNSLVSGYDFVNDQAGVPSEWTDLDSEAAASLEQSTVTVLDQSTVTILNQSTVTVLDQHTSEILSDPRYQSFGHGTMVAGLVHLVAPGARLMALKAFRADGSSNTADIVRAIYYAVDHGADVINMSFSMEGLSSEIMRAVNYATRRGVICVAAAGNQGLPAYVFPAGFANVMGVAGTTPSMYRSEISNYGEDLVSVAAPGEELITSYPAGHYAIAFGTSFSAALVSGTVSLLKSVDADIDPHGTELALANGRSIETDLGYGWLDVYETLGFWRVKGRTTAKNDHDDE